MGMKRGERAVYVAVRFPDPKAYAVEPVNCPSAISAGHRSLLSGETNFTGSGPKGTGQT